MKTPERFDVFPDHPSEPKLIASFNEFAGAKAAMEKMAARTPGKYFVWSSDEDELMAQVNTGTPWPQGQ
jgi:hypothetical protein